MEPLGSPTPPPAPRVAPIISGDYATDLNANRIHDALESAAGAPGGLSIASTELVEVELIFNEPVTQRQIDDFLRLGGQITYLYQAISYGWNGYISRQNINVLPSLMGPALVQVEAVGQIRYCMDTATQIGRVRPVWKAGFAGLPNGLRGDPKTTIGFLGGGVDATHADLRGRNVYWTDLTADKEPTPVDHDGHDTLVAAIAVGTGVAGGADDRELRFTYTYAEGFSPTIGHLTDPITLPARQVTMKSSAWWTGQTCILDQYRWTRGTEDGNLRSVGNYIRSKSPAVLTNSFMGSPNDLFNTLLLDYDTKKPVENVTIVTSLMPYPGVGDGLNKFGGVAPGCQWAAVKVFTRGSSSASSSNMTKGLDEFVAQSAEKNIKIVNISVGYNFLGIPDESASLRDKVNTMVNNGILVVVAAGNGANDGLEVLRKMSDPGRAAMAITVGASNDENALTEYSTYGFIMPRTNVGEDFKPDVIAPGGSYLYTGMMSAETGSSDGLGLDKEPNDYASGVGTSYAAPFVSGCAALIINAMEAQGVKWSFNSSSQPLYVKMLLCATASETNAKREGGEFNPALDRAAAGPEGFPPGKDQQEGYGLINPDAAVEAVCQIYAPGSTVNVELGGNASAKRVWARTVNLKAGADISVTLENPSTADYDLYLYGTVPSATGAPVLLASSTHDKAGDDETVQYTPTADAAALLVIKRVSGTGAATLRSVQAGPPAALDVQVTCGINAATTITLKATDDGRPTPPGAITYTIASKPAQGRLELPDGTPISTFPAKLANVANKVVYRPPADWIGQDSFTFYADDGGTAPFGGQSNTATVTITVLKEITAEYQVMASADDSHTLSWDTDQSLTNKSLLIGMHVAGMRFRNVKIPQGSTILSAKLKICAYTNQLTAEVNGILRGEASDNAAAFGDPGRAITQLAKTSASKDWKWTEDTPWSANTWYESPDISAIVQQIVDRPGWASDNALVIVYGLRETTFGSERGFWAYDGDPTKAAKLVVTYRPK